ncbi:MAG: hypothetical protein J1F35_08255 [Erysipelotrichales bacterium]|nr:hypothetical protein [Erysipelotrichales bacterium]
MKVWASIDPGYEDEVILFTEEPEFNEEEQYWFSPNEEEYVITNDATIRKLLRVRIVDTKHAFPLEVPNEWWKRKTKFS